LQGVLEVFAVKSADQINKVTTVAAGKAMPQVLAETDHKGVWVVATVNGTWANKPVSLPFEGTKQSFISKDCWYGDYFFEGVEL
jgi:hypothetical protein